MTKAQTTGRSGVTLRGGRIARRVGACAAFVLVPLLMSTASAAPADEVRTAFDQFVAAQNAHDLTAVDTLLLDSPNFLWITRGTAVWGHDAALKRFASLYGGTWRLDPEPSALKIIMIGTDAAQLYVPILFTIGAPGQAPQPTRFLMNQLLVRTPSGWRVSNILPIPSQVQ